MVKYTLDDTTGLVDCTHWKLRNKKVYNGEAGVVKGGNVPKGMSMTVAGDLVPSFTMLEGADAGDAALSSSSSAPAPMFAPESKTFQLGDIVRVRGNFTKCLNTICSVTYALASVRSAEYRQGAPCA